MNRRTTDGRAIPESAAVAVGRFRADGPIGYRAATLPDAPLRATREQAQDDEMEQP